MMALRPGTVFAKSYEIVRPISAGGMGIVYEVIHLGTKRHRALKVMLAHIVADPVMRARFALEAVVTAEVESEHLTEVFDAGIDEESDCPYLVMELLRGEDLGARIKRGERTDAAEVLALMDQVARTLEKTHAAGIVHRDLKPDNLFLTRRDDGSPRIKILDFGIAKLVKQDLTGPQATTKSFGTPYYMAREQITGESKLIGPSSDLYALAHITYALLTGAPYFEDEARSADGNLLTLLMAVGHGAVEPATQRALRRGVELPTPFDAWFKRAVAVSPQQRFASARAMMEELAVVLRDPVRFFAAAPSSPGSGAPRPELVSAASDRVEESLRPGQVGGPQSGGAAAPLFFLDTAGPQSITTMPTPKPAGAARWLVPIGGFLALGVGLGLILFFWSSAQQGPAPATQSHTLDSGRSSESAAASAPADRPTVTSTSASAASSVELSLSASVAPIPVENSAAPTAPSPAIKSAAKPAPKSGGGEVWEVR